MKQGRVKVFLFCDTLFRSEVVNYQFSFNGLLFLVSLNSGEAINIV